MTVYIKTVWQKIKFCFTLHYHIELIICISKEEPVDPEPGNRESSEPETPEENQTKIVVSNLPSTAHDEYLQMFFENKRFKGCDVYSVEMDEDGTFAIIEFETPEGK
jgi:hypothetical protein